jgi:hypothetical protein
MVRCLTRPAAFAPSPPSAPPEASSGLLQIRQREALAGTKLRHEGHLTKVNSLVSLAITILPKMSYFNPAIKSPPITATNPVIPRIAPAIANLPLPDNRTYS